MPVFQPAPMRRWSPIVVFKERPFSPPVLPAAIIDFKLMPYSGKPRIFPAWYNNWK